MTVSTGRAKDHRRAGGSRWARLAVPLIAVVVLTTVGVTAGGWAAWAKGTVATAPVITAQPLASTPPFGKTATFKVKVGGSPKPAVQWQVSAGGGAFTDTGSTSAALHVGATLAVDGNRYRAVATNASGSATSQSATLTIAASTKDKKVKARTSGLFDKGSGTPYQLNLAFPTTPTSELSGYAAAFSGIVVNQTWAQLEPTEGHPDFSSLDGSLAAVAAYNTANPSHPLTVKLRIFGGFTAPAWAKSLDGAPITVSDDPSRPAGGTLGRYWLPDYEQQWTDFQSALAQRYDKDTLVTQVAVTSCNTASAEPFILDRAIIAALTAAGWTQDDQVQCVERALGDYSGWQRTPVDFTMNSAPEAGASQMVVTQCAATVVTGQLPLCILDNHGLTDTVTAGQADLYASFNAAWLLYDGAAPVDFQTLSPNGLDLCAAVGIGIAHHAQSIEIWPPGASFPGFHQYTPAQLTAWNQALRNATAPNCT